MTDLTEVLQRATTDLAPEDPARLLDAAMRRGASLRRRRRATAALSAVGGVAAAATVAALLLGRSDAPGVVPPVTIGSTRTPTSPSTTDQPAPRVVVGRHQIGATFARIIPGTITREHDVAARHVNSPGSYQSEFEWNGYLVSVQLVPFTGSAHAKCQQGMDPHVKSIHCDRTRGGWAVHDDHMDDQSYNRWVSVYRDNGFAMWVLIYNSGAEKGTSSAGPPPLDVPALEKVATSPLWFG